MNLWNSLAGQVEVFITSADPVNMLTAINNAGIVILDVRIVDDIYISGVAFRRDYTLVSGLIRKYGGDIKIKRRIGVYWSFLHALHRPILITGVCFLILFTLWLPTRIFFVQVEGNITIPTKLILEKAQLCGIRFGSGRGAVRSERVKNNLLSTIPELQWAGINTRGCIAVITVKERSKEMNTELKNNVSSIVADRDGIITSLTVYSGNPVCKVGEAVEKGQLLVSGYSDCGICIKASASRAEIMAQTKRKISVVCMSPTYVKSESFHSDKQFSVLLGKKLINLFKYSGISSTGCDRIQKKSYVMLPGGFELPLAICIQSMNCNYLTTPPDHTEQDYIWLSDFADDYVTGHMIAGQIQGKTEQYRIVDGGCVYTADYLTVEMIGKVKLEENLDQTWNGQQTESSMQTE